MLCTLLAGCRVKRTLRVTSDPPGAVVRLDDERIGETPVSREFHHYGVRNVTVRLDGYRAHCEQIELRPPWYGRFPLDIVSEVLIPIGWKDHRRLRVKLIEGNDRVSPPELRSVFERADLLRLAGPEGPRELPPTRPRQLPILDGDSPEGSDGSDGSDGENSATNSGVPSPSPTPEREGTPDAGAR
jgi:hypothetical protein